MKEKSFLVILKKKKKIITNFAKLRKFFKNHIKKYHYVE